MVGLNVSELTEYAFTSTGKIYNDIILEVKVYNKPLTGLGTNEGDFKPYYSLCIGGTESKKAFSHSEFKWTSVLIDPSSNQPIRDYGKIRAPGSRKLGGAFKSGYEQSGHDAPLPSASEVGRVVATSAGEAASGAVDAFSGWAQSRLKSLTTRRQQTREQTQTRANEYLDFFKYALQGDGISINPNRLYKNLIVLINNFNFKKNTLTLFSFSDDYDPGSVYSGNIDSDTLIIKGGYRKKKTKRSNTKRKNTKRKNTKRRKTHNRKYKTKKNRKKRRTLKK